LIVREKDDDTPIHPQSRLRYQVRILA
jgi:hypothetical protein